MAPRTVKPSPTFALVVEQIISGRKVRPVADLVGCSHTAIYAMLAGRVPSYAFLLDFALGLGLDEEQMAALFTAAGYVLRRDGALSKASVEMEVMTERFKLLSPEQQRLVTKLLEDTKWLDALAASLSVGLYRRAPRAVQHG